MSYNVLKKFLQLGEVIIALIRFVYTSYTTTNNNNYYDNDG
jgi:hypothetical protein